MNREYRIDEICTMIKGQYPTLKTSPGKFPLVVTAGFRRSADTFQIDGEAVCVPLISSSGHGRATLNRVHYEKGRFAVANLLVALIVRDNHICFPKYLYYLLNTKKEEYFVPLMTGVANVSLKIKDVGAVRILLPSLSEQCRIVAKLDKITSRVEQVRRLAEQIEEEQTALLLRRVEEISKDASRAPITEVAPVVRRQAEIEPDNWYPELGIRSFGKGTFHKDAIKGSELGSKRLYQIMPGDLLFSNVFSWEGAIAVVQSKDKGRFGSHRFITCVPHPERVTAQFLCWWFLGGEGLADIRAASPGAAGRNKTLGIKKLEAIEVPLPPIDLQQKFGEIIRWIQRSRIIHQQTTASLEALMPSLLDQAFRGEL